MKKLVFALFVLFFALQASAQYGVAASQSQYDYGGFYPNIYADGFKWCSNQPSGQYCEQWRDSCNQISSVSYGQSYYAYFEVKDVVDSAGNYNYALQLHKTSPDGTYSYNNGWNNRGTQAPGSWPCWWLSFPGSSFATPAGTWKHEVKLTNYLKGDVNNSFQPSIEAACTATYQCTAGQVCRNGGCLKLPDLTVTDIKVSPERPVGGMTTQLIGYIRNAGSAAIPAASVWFTTKFFADNIQFKNVPWAGIKVNEEITPSGVTTLSDGQHSIRVLTDSEGQYEELREDNNELVKSFLWESNKPDLLISSLEINPFPPTGGQNALLQVFVKEAQNRVVLERALVDVYVDGNKQMTFTIFAMPAEGLVLKYWLVKPSGTHSIRVVVDSGNTVPESNENNNEHSKDITWADPTRILQNLTGLESEYYAGDAIAATILAKTPDNSPVQSAEVTIKDSFGGGATLATNAEGKAAYTTTASKSGVHYIELKTSKPGYSTVWQKHSFKVIDYNARIHATVHTPQGTPIAGANLYRNKELRATTDRNGKAHFTTTKGLNNINAYCPDGTYCTNKLADVQNTSFLDFSCECKLGEPAKIVLKGVNTTALPVGVPDLTGKPVAFAQIVENGEFLGLTDLNGELKIPSLGYGKHVLIAHFCVKNETDEACSKQLQTPPFEINHTKADSYEFRVNASMVFAPMEATTLATTYQGPETVLGVTNYSSQAFFIPLVLAAVWVVVTYHDATELQTCADGQQIKWDSQAEYERLFRACGEKMLWLGVDFIPGAAIEKGVLKISTLAVKTWKTLPEILHLTRLGQTLAVKQLANSQTWQIVARNAGKTTTYLAKYHGRAKRIVYQGVEYVVRVDDTATAALLSTDLGKYALARWESAAAQKGLANIITFQGENIAKRLQTLFDLDVILKTSIAEEKGIYKASEFPALTMAETIRTAQRAGLGDIVSAGGEQQLIRAFNNPKGSGTILKYGDREIPSVAAFTKGKVTVGNIGGWGSDHVFVEIRETGLTRAQDIQRQFNLPNADSAVYDLTGEAIRNGFVNAKGLIEYHKSVGEKTKRLQIRLGDDPNKVGRIITILGDDIKKT